MERGYVKLWRKTLDSGLMENPTALQLFMYLILETTHRPRKFSSRGVIVDLQPGDAIFSRIAVSKKLKMSEQCARTALNFLKKLEILTTKVTNRFTIVSFVNWDTYQNEKPAPNQQTNQHLTSSQPAPNQHLTTAQECKNEECKNIYKTPLTPLGGEPVCEGEPDTPSPSPSPTPDPAPEPEPEQKPKRKPAGTGNTRTELLALVELYTLDHALRQSLTSFVMMRQHNHHPLTGDGLKKLLSRLDRLAVTDEDKVAIVDQSIMLSWRGFFPLRDETNGNHQPRAKPDGVFERQAQTMREVYAEMMEDRKNDTAARFGNSAEIGSNDSLGTELWQGLPQGSCKNVDSFAGAI